ncbi:hypothetical protein D3Y59_10050 [Hymenobacter oligotrophus]|uniref:Tail specific protease domain-containing protein n=1 Tax=Hymenobacter oligotrophus TaxID=2319843 RepID=A0A3B7R8C4_9BACT|nr:S41 family peptidase [Hymenobacter oligotrophus]AYA37361.1 hypothetical protein D3Y59_10050 [Hymenobacter oligotrophus]
MKALLGFVCLLVGVAQAAWAQQQPAPLPAAPASSLTLLEPPQLQQDLDSLHAWLHATHPNLHLRLSHEADERQWQRVRAQLNQPLTAGEFAQLVMPLTTQYADGHTGLSYDFSDAAFQAYSQRGGLFFPLNVTLQKGKLYVAESAAQSEVRPGALIRRINGESADALVQNMLRYWPADHQKNREATTARLFGFTLWSLYGWGESVQLEFQNYGQRQKQTTTLRGIPAERLMQLMNVGPRKYKLTLHEPESLAVLEFFGFQQNKATTAFLDSAFTVIKQKGIRHLAVDIRRNGGGNSAVGAQLLQYLTTKPYLQGAAKELRYSQALPQQPYNKWFKDLLAANQGNANGRYRHSSTPQPPAPLAKPELFFSGKFYLLTGPRTFSSAHMLAAAVKAYHLGTIVGEETGNAMRFFGEPLSFQLPNTKLWGMCAGAEWWAADYTSQTQDTGVQPDVEVKPTPKDLAEGTDAVLQYLKQAIAAQDATASAQP